MGYYGNNDYITIVEKTDEQYHRSRVILHRGGTGFYFAEFDNTEQLEFFAQTLGFTYSPAEWRDTERFGIYREYTVDRKFVDYSPGGFTSMEDIPEDAKPIKALSNGSIVTCYFTNDGEKITFYRPNGNYRNIYHPLTIEQHIQHQKIYGKY